MTSRGNRCLEEVIRTSKRLPEEGIMTSRTKGSSISSVRGRHLDDGNQLPRGQAPVESKEECPRGGTYMYM